jgi:phenylalanyl-tRNA synthetase alpha chain
MKERLLNIEKEAMEALASARDKNKVTEIKTRYLGRKGELTSLIKEIWGVSPDERPEIGRLANKIKQTIEEKAEALLKGFLEKETEEARSRETLDVTLPGRRLPPGRKHPITQIMDEIVDIFLGLGFDVAEGPEIETDYYNFEALNIPADHPARDMQDTFYIGDDLLLRTHTSPVQIRVMERKKPPLRIIAPGTVYRRDSDISHTPMFHQVEGLMVDETVTFGDLKGVLTIFLHQLCIVFRF